MSLPRRSGPCQERCARIELILTAKRLQGKHVGKGVHLCFLCNNIQPVANGLHARYRWDVVLAAGSPVSNEGSPPRQPCLTPLGRPFGKPADGHTARGLRSHGVYTMGNGSVQTKQEHRRTSLGHPTLCQVMHLGRGLAGSTLSAWNQFVHAL